MLSQGDTSLQKLAQLTTDEDRGDFRNYTTECFAQSYLLGQGLLEITWSDGMVSRFDADWLQDNCDCNKCLHPTSKEPLLHYTEKDLLHYTEKDFGKISYVDSSASGLTIVWDDGHVSFFSNGWLRAHSVEVIESSPRAQFAMLWEAAAFKMPTYKYVDLEQPKVFYGTLCDLEKYGVVLFTEVPREDQQVLRFAERIGAIRSTTFGTYFDVLAKIDPNSNAYTPLGLHSHTDLAHHDSPPAYQLLHFLENEAKGGSSTFVDGLAVAAALNVEQPEVFGQLTRPIYNFRFQDENADHYYRGAMAPIIAPIGEARRARAAIKMLFDYLSNPRFRYECRLNAGDLVIFANTRLLHGRTAFEPATGKRHLRVLPGPLRSDESNAGTETASRYARWRKRVSRPLSGLLCDHAEFASSLH